MKAIARFIFRNEKGKANLILGTCFKDQDYFKGNDVWQIEEILGELTLKKVGESVVGEVGHKGELIGCNWDHSVNDILDYGKYIFLTKEEFKAQVEREEREQKERLI